MARSRPRVVTSTSAEVGREGVVTNVPGNNFEKHQSKNPIVRRMMDQFHAAVIERVIETGRSTLLDVGCGEGYSTSAISVASGVKSVACDLEISVLKTAAIANPGHQYSAASVYQLPFAAQSFDIVLGTEVLEHLDNPSQALVEVGRVSREWVILTVPLEPWWRVANVLRGAYLSRLGNTPGHVQHWSRRAFARLLEQEFSEVTVERVALWSVAVCRK